MGIDMLLLKNSSLLIAMVFTEQIKHPKPSSGRLKVQEKH